jgi:hypothetical protein
MLTGANRADFFAVDGENFPASGGFANLTQQVITALSQEIY